MYFFIVIRNTVPLSQLVQVTRQELDLACQVALYLNYKYIIVINNTSYGTAQDHLRVGRKYVLTRQELDLACQVALYLNYKYIIVINNT